MDDKFANLSNGAKYPPPKNNQPTKQILLYLYLFRVFNTLFSITVFIRIPNKLFAIRVWYVVLILNKCYNSCMYINLELCCFYFLTLSLENAFKCFWWSNLFGWYIYIKCHITIRREIGLSFALRQTFDSNGEAVYIQCMHGFIKFQVWINWFH